jgi:Fe-S oxidoreductase
MFRSKAVQVKRNGQSLQDRVLGQVDRLGRLYCIFAPLVNWANRNRLNRWLIEKLLGIHRDRLLPDYVSETFRRWFSRRGPSRFAPGADRVALFYTCSVNYNVPSVGKACVGVLEKNRIEVVCPEQRCCGMPFLDGGDIEAARDNARANIDALYPLVREGYDVVVPGPTCSYVLKRDYPLLLEGKEVEAVTAKVFDVCEYLVGLHARQKLDTRFVKGAGRVAYQIPCHLRAQNIGYKSRDLMELLPNTTVEVIEKCSAVDGTWGLKRQYFELSMKVAEPLLTEIRESRADAVASDCPLAALQIKQGTGETPRHPIQLLEAAYGLGEER